MRRNFLRQIAIIVMIMSSASCMAQAHTEASRHAKESWYDSTPGQASGCRTCDKCVSKGKKPRTRRYCYLDPKGACAKNAKSCCYANYGSPSYYVNPLQQYYGWGYFGRRTGFAY